MLLSLLLLLVCLFLESRAKDFKSGKQLYVDVGSQQKSSAALQLAGAGRLWKIWRRLAYPKKKTSDSYPPLADESPKN